MKHPSEKKIFDIFLNFFSHLVSRRSFITLPLYPDTLCKKKIVSIRPVKCEVIDTEERPTSRRKKTASKKIESKLERGDARRKKQTAIAIKPSRPTYNQGIIRDGIVSGPDPTRNNHHYGSKFDGRTAGNVHV